MAYVFGDTFICADKQAAQAVTFNKNIGVKSVTLEGDVYDPSGTLSGGAAPSSSGILVKVQELKAIEIDIQKHKSVVEEVSRELANAKKMIDAFRKDKRELDIREHEVKLLEEQVGGSNATKVSCLIRPGSSKLIPDHRRGRSSSKDASRS
jgi:structural maintenance of chromosome 2